jgi:hypothetical protein
VSGAPLVSAKDEVVGLLIGGLGAEGIVNPAVKIRRRLAESGKKDRWA